MPAANNGSIALNIFNSISPMPSNISGLLIAFTNNQIFFTEQYTGATIGTTSIAERYQSAITDLTTANILRLIAVQDMGVNFVKVGDVSTNNDNLFTMAKEIES